MSICIRFKFGYLSISTLHFMLNILNFAWAQQNSWDDSTIFPVDTLQCTDHPELIDLSLRSLSNISRFLEILEEGKPVVRGTGNTHCKWAPSLGPTHYAGHCSSVWKWVRWQTHKPTRRILSHCKCLAAIGYCRIGLQIAYQKLPWRQAQLWGKIIF